MAWAFLVPWPVYFVIARPIKRKADIFVNPKIMTQDEAESMMTTDQTDGVETDAGSSVATSAVNSAMSDVVSDMEADE